MTEPAPPPERLDRTPWEHLTDVFGPDPDHADTPSGEHDAQAAADAQEATQ